MYRFARSFLICLLAAGTVFAQAAAVKPNTPHENLNAVVWMQTSAEYRASALQTYHSAEASMMRALNDKNWTAALEQKRPVPDLPPAVILDLDETVFDNSAFQARLATTGTTFTPENWNSWVAEKRAGLVPGARAFLLAAHANGVAPFYVTNRVCDPNRADDPTVVLLKAHLLPFRPERLLCKTETPDKSARRNLVAAGNRVLLLIGDDLNDFITAAVHEGSVDVRIAAVDAYDRYWGERWFMLPNPTYGSWEAAVGRSSGNKWRSLRQ